MLRPLLLPLVLLAASLAHAAHYKVTYSGGSANADIYGDTPYAQGAYGYGGGGGRFDSASGAITATFQWTNESRDPNPVPPPDKVIVIEGCIVDANGGGSNGFGDPAMGTRYGERGQPYGMDFIPHYSIHGGDHFTLTCSPSASGDPYGASVTYTASYTPVVLSVDGTSLIAGDLKTLIGRGQTGSIGASGFDLKNHHWTVSGPQLFDHVDWSAGHAYAPFNGAHTDPTVSFFASKDGSEMVSCNCDVYVSGTTTKIGSVNTSAIVEVERPVYSLSIKNSRGLTPATRRRTAIRRR